MVWIKVLIVVGAIVLLTPVCVTLLLYWVWRYDRCNSAAPRAALSAGRMMCAMLAECAALAAFMLTSPVSLIQNRWPLRVRQSARKPVILIHGYGGNASNFLWLQWRLRRSGFVNCYAVSYVPPYTDCRKLAVQVVGHVQRIQQATGARQVDVVCHSMGGLLIRHALRDLDLAGRVDRVVTVGTPHHGTRATALVPAWGAIAQMHYHGAFVARLAQGEDGSGGARFYCIYSEMDNIVFPADTACLEASERTIRLLYLGHASLLYSRRVATAVRACLAE